MSERLIARGGFGEVMQVGDQTPFIAVKYVWINPKLDRKRLEREFRVLEKLYHPNIVKYYGMNETTRGYSPHFAIYMEFCEQSLASVLKDQTITYTMKTVFEWVEHLAMALVYLKDNKVLHRDLKPDNVLVINGFILKVGDFGLCKDLTGASSMSHAGTIRYMAPEASGALGPVKTEYKSDLYAFGLILFEIFERRLVFSPTYDEYGFNQNALFSDLKEEVDVFDFSTDCNPVLKEIVLCCTQFEIENRPDVDVVLAKIVENKKQFDEERFEPIIEPNRRQIQKPTCFFTQNARDEPNLKEDSAVTMALDPSKPSDAIHYYEAYFGDEEQTIDEEQTLKTLGDAIAHLKMLAHQCDTELFTKIENRIRECLIIPQGSIFLVDEYPEFPQFLDQELEMFLRQMKYQSVYEKISLIADKWICFVRKEFRNLAHVYLEMLTCSKKKWYNDKDHPNQPSQDGLMKAYKGCYSILKASGNFFFSQYFKLTHYNVHSTNIVLISKKRNLFIDLDTAKVTVNEGSLVIIDSILCYKCLDDIIVKPQYRDGFHLEALFDLCREAIERISTKSDSVSCFV